MTGTNLETKGDASEVKKGKKLSKKSHGKQNGLRPKYITGHSSDGG